MTREMRIFNLLEPTLILRLGAWICFIGHGILAINGKTQFIDLLGTFGIEGTMAVWMLRLIGTLDVITGALILVKPNKWILSWAVLWTSLTIIAWGIHGDSLMDLFRRVTYITTPLTLIFMLNHRNKKEQNGKVISTRSISGENAIWAMDLSMICMKLQNHHEGEGWTEKQCLEAAKEYRRYLKLKLLYPNENIVPNRAIDTLWHYHILDTAAYYKDCMAIFGKILHHYPYFGMHGEKDAENFFNSFDRTKYLYEKTFSTSMNDPEYLSSFRQAG